MASAEEYLTIRLVYRPSPISPEHGLEGFLEGLKTPVLSLLSKCRGKTDEINIRLVLDGNGVGAVVEARMPIDSDSLAVHLRYAVAKLVEDIFSAFPDRIEIIYEEAPRNDRP